MEFKPFCAWEGPRGGDCPRAGRWKFRAGTIDTAHLMAWSCDQHLEAFVKEGRGLDVGEPVVRLGQDGEDRPAREVLAEMRAPEPEPSLFDLAPDGSAKIASTHATAPTTRVRTGGYL